MMVDKGTVTLLERIRIAPHKEAHGHGAAILLTHGFGATCRMWDEQIEELTDRYRLVLWDLPGHGQSGAPEPDLTPGSLIEDMRSVLDSETTEPAVLIGLGIGGLLSLRFYHAHPDRVRALVLIGAMPGLRSGAARDIWNSQVEDTAKALEQGGLDALEGGAEVDPRNHSNALDLARAARLLLTQHDSGALAWLPAIDVPVLILVGSEDKPNLTAAAFMARVIPNARHVVIPRANHAANIHKPNAVNAAIRDFLLRLPITPR
jgi:pimeloyl-ACP methyl ester carboxylesterase